MELKDIPSSYMYGVTRRSRFRAMAGPVPTHAVVNVNFQDVTLCSGSPALAYTNGGGAPCRACLAAIAAQEGDED